MKCCLERDRREDKSLGLREPTKSVIKANNIERKFSIA